jgi:hypothetical protein
VSTLDFSTHGRPGGKGGEGRTNPIFQNILVGGIKWAIGEVNAEAAPNLKEVAPEAFTHPPYPARKPATASQKAN